MIDDTRGADCDGSPAHGISESFPSARPLEAYTQENSCEQKQRGAGRKEKRKVFGCVAKMIGAVRKNNVAGQTAVIENDERFQP